MFYRISLDLAFNEEDPCRDIMDKALDHFDGAHIINPDLPNEERGFITLEKCYHDEEPNKPCEIIEDHSL